ncbi:MAG: hypothetical protein HY536_01705 [Candidatus Colwellbacteria bacterium]|nr:hypothetical protein [Candidatus Colwellbacteria bacterium]
MRRTNQGQSLIEVTIGLALGALVVGSATLVLTSSLTSSGGTKLLDGGRALGAELLNSAKAFAASDWGSVSALSGSLAPHSLATNQGALSIQDGGEAVTMNSVSYTRSFVVQPVSRDVSGAVTAGAGVDDPSTKRIIVTVSWNFAGKPQSTTLESFVARLANRSTRYTDWSGGSGKSGPGASPDSGFFSASSSLDTASAPGSFRLKPPIQ